MPVVVAVFEIQNLELQNATKFEATLRPVIDRDVRV
jgi:hypothetical protein